MKKLLAVVLALTMLGSVSLAEGAEPQFGKMNDPSLLPYLQDTIYQSLVENLNSDEYFVENVSTIYISDEYLEELAFNSQTNIYFGYTLEDLEKQFQGSRYVFTLSETNETTVQAWEAYDDVMERVIRNVAIGTGVILVCVTVSVVTAGAGAPAVSMIFAVAAKSGAVCALSGGTIGAVAAGTVDYIQNGDVDSALKAAALGGSEGYKWGAISGAIAGGTSEFSALKGATLNGLSMNEAAIIQKESSMPLSIIKEFHSVDEYNVYKEAGLFNKMVGNRSALIRNIDWNRKDGFGNTNLERMLKGNPPLDSNGMAYELHHVGQKNDSIFAILTQGEHRGEGNFRILHDVLRGSEVDHGAAFSTAKTDFWKNLAEIVISGGI